MFRVQSTYKYFSYNHARQLDQQVMDNTKNKLYSPAIANSQCPVLGKESVANIFENSTIVLTKHLTFAEFICYDNAQCNGHGDCNDEQCDCDSDWSSQVDCSGNISSQSFNMYLIWVCSMTLFGQKEMCMWSLIFRFFRLRTFYDQDIWPTFDILILAKSKIFKNLVYRKFCLKTIIYKCLPIALQCMN